jgi:hypothetical protein
LRKGFYEDSVVPPNSDDIFEGQPYRNDWNPADQHRECKPLELRPGFITGKVESFTDIILGSLLEVSGHSTCGYARLHSMLRRKKRLFME